MHDGCHYSPVVARLLHIEDDGRLCCWHPVHHEVRILGPQPELAVGGVEAEAGRAEGQGHPPAQRGRGGGGTLAQEESALTLRKFIAEKWR